MRSDMAVHLCPAAVYKTQRINATAAPRIVLITGRRESVSRFAPAGKDNTLFKRRRCRSNKQKDSHMPP